jgi:hypothetical protein
MPPETQAALIAGAVSLITATITAIIGGSIALKRMRREQGKWLTELKSTYAAELYQARLAAYPHMQEIMGQLSSQAQEPLTPAQAHHVAQQINQWIYSSGGLVAETSTRAAILGLRDACAAWHEGPPPQEILEWRNAALFLLRRDLDVLGLESRDALKDRTSLLAKIQTEISEITR